MIYLPEGGREVVGVNQTSLFVLHGDARIAGCDQRCEQRVIGGRERFIDVQCIGHVRAAAQS